MKDRFIALLMCGIFYCINVGAQCSTFPDDCSSACHLGALPVPSPCGVDSSKGAKLSFDLTNTGATASNATLLNQCTPYPAADVWYSFTATAVNLVLSVKSNSPSLDTINVSVYKGDCNQLVGIDCFTGAGTVNRTIPTMRPGSTYYLRISGLHLQSQGDFRLNIGNDADCASCLRGSDFSSSPPPVNGAYRPGQTVSFCFTVTEYAQTQENYLHGVVLKFGKGWDTSTLTPTSFPLSCRQTIGAHWIFKDTVTSQASQQVWGPGFFYETSVSNPSGLIDDNPGNNYGDKDVGLACPVTFCWRIRVDSLATDGADLSVNVKTTNDWQSGSWTAIGCLSDPTSGLPYAVASSCSPPDINVQNASCGVSNGSAVAIGSGIGPWHYTWRDAVGDIILERSSVRGPDPIENLSAGQYFLTVSDSLKCTHTAIANIGGLSDSFALDINPVSCFGSSPANGQLVIRSFIPQNVPYSYSLNNSAPQASNTFSNLSAGNYSVIAVNKFGCADTLTATINQPQPILISDTAITPAGCLTGGSVRVSVTGGTGLLNLNWSNSQAGDSIGNLSGGNYVLTITDQNLCTVVDTFNIAAAPGAISFAAPIIINDSCNGDNKGSIKINATGGTGALRYQWNNLDTTSLITRLFAGSYAVTVTDGVGCSATNAYNLTQPTPLILGNAVINPVACRVNGSIKVSATGGTGTKSYRWGTSSGTLFGDSIFNLTADAYTLTVTDQNGCSLTSSYVVGTAANTFTLVPPNILNITCNNFNNGQITAVTAGGVGTIKYRWSTGDSTVAIANLAQGSYSVTATDLQGCSVSATYQIINPKKITLGSATVIDATCKQAGSIGVRAFNGTGAFMYSWSGGLMGDSIRNLSAGIYTLTVTDQNQCSITAIYRVGASDDAISLTEPVITNTTCHGGHNGSITASAAGGTESFTYVWNTQATTPTITGLTAGTYYVTATDGAGCIAINFYTIGQPTAITLGSNPIINTAGCITTGSIQVTASGGTGNLSYRWSNGKTGTTNTGLAAGPYTLTVTDQNQCSVTVKYTVVRTQNGIGFTMPAITNVLCHGDSTGNIIASATGGTGTKKYKWNNNATTAEIDKLSAGIFSVTVTDDGNCSATVAYIVDEPKAIQPNLSLRGFICPGGEADTATVNPTGGMPGYTYLWSGGSTTNSSILLAGEFFVTIRDTNNCTVTVTDTSHDIIPPVFVPDIYMDLCAANPYEDVKLVEQNNRSAFTFYAAGIDTNTTGIFNGIPALPEGSAGIDYPYFVIDSFGCRTNATFRLEADARNSGFSVIPTDATCFGFANGQITISPIPAQAGTPLYVLDGGTAQTDTVFNNLTAGYYRISITNTATHCDYNSEATITQPSAHTLTANPELLVLEPNATGAVVVTSDFQNNVFDWSPSGGLSCIDCDSTIITAGAEADTLEYMVRAFSVNDTTCFVSKTVTVIIKAAALPDSLVMPTAFTPNGDDRNDVFRPVPSTKYANAVIKNFQVFNRWGQMVHNGNTGWDGRFNGTEQPVGTYLYYIEVEYTDPDTNSLTKSVQQRGAVTLLR